MMRKTTVRPGLCATCRNDTHWTTNNVRVCADCHARNHLTISLTKNRSITLTHKERNRPTVVEFWTFDQDEMRDSQALHHVLTIRDPGDNYVIRFNDFTPVPLPTN
jgi:hypothetical protein